MATYLNFFTLNITMVQVLSLLMCYTRGNPVES